jgi:2-polyprenyl-3-methyl-5-hydroxy-6-metoxy-1,4-benzoquinol methylase
MMKRVGREVSAHDYWNSRTDRYVAQIHGPYHRHRLQVIERLIAEVNFRDALVIDFGCGDGVMMETLVERGAKAIGIDPSADFVKAANTRLRGRADVICGGVDALQTIQSNSADCVLALNVIAYLSTAEERAFYEHASRVLKKGGSLVVTHSNELFDLYTANRMTVEFYCAYSRSIKK